MCTRTLLGASASNRRSHSSLRWRKIIAAAHEGLSGSIVAGAPGALNSVAVDQSAPLLGAGQRDSPLARPIGNEGFRFADSALPSSSGMGLYNAAASSSQVGQTCRLSDAAVESGAVLLEVAFEWGEFDSVASLQIQHGPGTTVHEIFSLRKMK